MREAAPLVRLAGIRKTYGETRALDGIDLEAYAGETVGIVGHNGAGKSTLMRVLTGVAAADAGTVELAGADVTGRYSPMRARALGLRTVYQELSLCPNLRVFENLLAHHPELRGPGWHKTSRQLIADSLNRIFPSHHIRITARIGDLSIAERQMVEIASAATKVGPPLRVLLLDEPTSSLDAEAAESLFRFLREERSAGLLCFFVSHRLTEIREQTDRIYAMRDGRMVASDVSAGLSREDLVRHVSGGAAAVAVDRQETAQRQGIKRERQPIHLEVHGLTTPRLHDVSITVHAGEIVGLAGLENQGQRALLQAIFERRHQRRRRGAMRLTVPVAYASGDRGTEGIFHLWSLGENITIGALRRLAQMGLLRRRAERRLADEWVRRLGIQGGSATSSITDLSGGNQQKAVVARALVSQAQLVLFDDPMRGVDMRTKRDLYRLLHQSTEAGCSFLWYPTDNDELTECDRVYVMRDGRIVKELLQGELTEERIVEASFHERSTEEVAR